jgi:putative aldouronate transport system substrate-binding protein
MNMKKLLVFLLAFALTAQVFAGGASQRRSQGAGTARVGAKGSLPLATTRPTLTYGILAGTVSSSTSYAYADHLFVKKVVDETRINIEYVSISSRDQENIMLSTGTYPDILMDTDMNPVDVAYYGSQGIFQALDAYDPLGYPNIKKGYADFPAMLDKVKGSDGRIYGLPWINECLHCLFNYGRAFYYMPWFRDSNRRPPQTQGEFIEALRWIQNTDLNKNGRKDEIPLAFNSASTENFIAYIMKSFMPYVGGGIALYDKKVTEQYKDPLYREGLRLISRLYQEGLILQDSFTMNAEQFRALMMNADPVVGFAMVNWPNSYSDWSRQVDYINADTLKGPGGQRYAPNKDPWSIMWPGFYVTDKCNDPELAVALYDYFLNDDAHLSGCLGPRGVIWDWADPGALGVGGGTPVYKSLQIPADFQTTNYAFDEHFVPSIRRASFFFNGRQTALAREVIDWINTGNPAARQTLTLPDNAGDAQETYWYNTMRKYLDYRIPDEYFIPPISYSEDDNRRIADINATLVSYIQQAAVQFITGARSLDNDWNAYLAELDRLGSAEKARITQKYIR